MKILLISSDNSKTSGAFRSLVQLACHLKNDFNNEIEVILSCDGDGYELLEQNEIKYSIVKTYYWITTKKIISGYRYKNILKYPLNIFNVAKVKRILIEKNPDIVHVNTLCTYLFGEVAENLGIPVIWHAREFLEEDQNTTFINKKKSFNVLSKAENVICISKAIQNKFIKFGLTNTKLIYNGIDKNSFANNHIIFIGKKLNFCMVGRVYKEKGQVWIVESLIKMINENLIDKDQFCLNIIGVIDENYTKQITKRIKELNLESCFKFIGPSNQVNNFLNQSDIFFMNSQCEPFGRVTIEAMMSGCLVIGAICGCTPELIQNDKTGVLYDFENYENFKNQMLKVLSNENKFKEIAKLGQTYAIENFNSLKNACEINNLYFDVICKHNAKNGNCSSNDFNE